MGKKQNNKHKLEYGINVGKHHAGYEHLGPLFVSVTTSITSNKLVQDLPCNVDGFIKCSAFVTL